MLDRSTLEHLFPTASAAVLDAFAAQNEQVFTDFKISQSANRLHFFLAQIGHESGGLKIREENLNYSAKRMREVWPSRFPTLASTQGFANNPKALANKVYNGRMGNVVGTDDGYNFRGRGFLQVTGRDGYAEITKRTGLDAENNPSLLNDPENGLIVACAMWDWKNCNSYADQGNFVALTKKINGGYIGLQDRLDWLKKVQNIVHWPIKSVAAGDKDVEASLSVARIKAVQVKLQALGLYAGSIDGILGKISRAGLKSYQASHGLAGAGKITQATLAHMGV